MMKLKSIASNLLLKGPTVVILTLIFGLGGFDTFANDEALEIHASKVNDPKHWKKDRVIRGFTVYTSHKKDSKIVPIKVEGIIEAPITSILEHLRDIETNAQWTPDLEEKITLADHGPKKAITYSLTDMPWPIYDRVLILENELFLDKKRKLLFVLSKSVNFDSSTLPTHKKTIEAQVGYSHMGFRPISKDKTYVQFTAWVDPKGSIPVWVINFFQKKWPVSFFEALGEQSRNYPTALRPGLMKMLRDLLKEMGRDPKSFD